MPVCGSNRLTSDIIYKMNMHSFYIMKLKFSSQTKIIFTLIWFIEYTMHVMSNMQSFTLITL